MILDDALNACPAVAIIRGVTPPEAVNIGEALYAGGLRAVEVPLNSPDPLQSISALAKAFKGRMVVGAGTVLRAEQVEAVAAAHQSTKSATPTPPTAQTTAERGRTAFSCLT